MIELSIRQAAARLRMRRAALAALCAARKIQHTRHPHVMGRPILIPLAEVERLEQLRQPQIVRPRGRPGPRSRRRDSEGDSGSQ